MSTYYLCDCKKVPGEPTCPEHNPFISEEDFDSIKKNVDAWLESKDKELKNENNF